MITHQPQTLDSKHRQIQELLSRQSYQEAEELLNTQLKHSAQTADTHYLYGVLHFFKGHIKKTIEHLKKALEINPKHTDASICLSILLNDIGKYHEAKQIFDQANQSIHTHPLNGNFEIDRKFSLKHLELADLYFRYRRYDEAIEEYSKASRLDPFTLETRIRKAKTFAKKGFFTRSIQELQQLKKEHPDYTPAHIQLGLLHYSQGNILDAELEWEAVLAQDPNHQEAITYLEMAKKARPLT